MTTYVNLLEHEFTTLVLKTNGMVASLKDIV